jgi:hypothetical protein
MYIHAPSRLTTATCRGDLVNMLSGTADEALTEG